MKNNDLKKYLAGSIFVMYFYWFRALPILFLLYLNIPFEGSGGPRKDSFIINITSPKYIRYINPMIIFAAGVYIFISVNYGLIIKIILYIK